MNKPTVLFVVGAKYYGESFDSSNYENYFNVIKLVDSSYCSKWNVIIRLKMRLGKDISSYYKKRDKKLLRKIMSLNARNKIDIVFLKRKRQLGSSFIAELKKTFLLVTNPPDRIVFYNADEQKQFFAFDHIYSYSQEDCDFVNSNGGSCSCINAVEPKKYVKKLNLKKDIDVSFIGRMYPEKDYGDRFFVLKKLVYDLPQLKFFIGGECAPLRRPKKFLFWLFHKRIRKCFVNKDLSRRKANEIYNRSKICININRFNTGNTWTDRLINIMGTGAFQIVEYNDLVVETFGKTMEYFSSYEELKTKIVFYLNNEEKREQIAQASYDMLLTRINEDKKNTISSDLFKRYLLRLKNEHS